MAHSKFGYLSSRSTVRTFDRADYPISMGSRRETGLQYSSPWPWINALAISMALWAIIAWLTFLS